MEEFSKEGERGGLEGVVCVCGWNGSRPTARPAWTHPHLPHQPHHKPNLPFTHPPNKQNNPKFTALPGAVELVADMLESEIPSAVISNLPLEAIEAVLDAIGLKV